MEYLGLHNKPEAKVYSRAIVLTGPEEDKEEEGGRG
jgi:hypothetical protein